MANQNPKERWGFGNSPTKGSLLALPKVPSNSNAPRPNLSAMRSFNIKAENRPPKASTPSLAKGTESQRTNSQNSSAVSHPIDLTSSPLKEVENGPSQEPRRKNTVGPKDTGKNTVGPKETGKNTAGPKETENEREKKTNECNSLEESSDNLKTSQPKPARLAPKPVNRLPPKTSSGQSTLKSASSSQFPKSTLSKTSKPKSSAETSDTKGKKSGKRPLSEDSTPSPDSKRHKSSTKLIKECSDGEETPKPFKPRFKPTAYDLSKHPEESNESSSQSSPAQSRSSFPVEMFSSSQPLDDDLEAELKSKEAPDLYGKPTFLILFCRLAKVRLTDPLRLCCPFCDEPLPLDPSLFLMQMIQDLKALKPPRRVNSLNSNSLELPFAVCAPVCKRHRDEKDVLPLGQLRGWPSANTIDWAQFARVRDCTVLRVSVTYLFCAVE